MSSNHALDRRSFLRSLAATIATLLATGCKNALGPRPRRTSYGTPLTTPLPPVANEVVSLVRFDTVALGATTPGLAGEDLGLTLLGGTSGIVNPPGGSIVTIDLDTSTTTPAGKLHWDFSPNPDPHAFIGWYFSVGRLDVPFFDGVNVQTVDLMDRFTLNTNDVFAPAILPRRRVTRLRLRVRGDGSVQVLTPKVELRDSGGRLAAVRFRLDPATTSPRTLDIPLDRLKYPSGFDRARLKQVNIVIERDSDNIQNPVSATFYLEEVSFVTDAPEVDPSSLTDDDFLESIARRQFQYALGFTDDATGLALDRSHYPDLLHVGASGFLAPALCVGASRGYIDRTLALARILQIARHVDNPALFGAQGTGTLGYRGFFYRFLGMDGLRKLDQSDPNAVEVSTIDTALLCLGLRAARSFFSSATDADEIELRTRVTAILGRVEWDFMIEPASGQLYMSWKPSQDPNHEIPAPGGGFFSSKPGPLPLTIDYYTSEGQIAALEGIATGRLGIGAWYSMIRDRPTSVVRTFPGAFFTFSYLSSIFIDLSSRGPDRGAANGTIDVDWYANTAQAIITATAGQSPSRLAIPDAVELPSNEYLSQGHLALSVDQAPHDRGTLSEHTPALALVYTKRQSAIAELRRAATYLNHGLYGLPDAYHEDLSTFSFPPNPNVTVLRTQGPWVQASFVGLNKLAAFLAVMNAQDRAVFDLIDADTEIQTAVSLIYQ